MIRSKVLSVGQCGMDHSAIERLLQREFDAEVVPVDSADAAFMELRRQKFDLVLVNRIFDLGGSGLDFVASLKAGDEHKQVPVMLVSDLPEAQRRAIELGAAPGFGKSALSRPETVLRIGAALVANGAGEPDAG